MNVRLPQRLPRTAHSHLREIIIRVRPGIAAGLTIVALLLSYVPALAAGPVKGASGANPENPGQSYAPIGDSGYRVPIPEINMNRLFGGQQQQQPQQQPQQSPQKEDVQRAPSQPPPVEKKRPAGTARSS